MTSSFETAYLNLLNTILTTGRQKNSRPGLGTLSCDDQQIVVDISDYSLPLLSTKKIFWPIFFHETIWFLSGSTNVKYLKDNNINIWDSWVIPKTAVFEPTDKPSASDILTYIRCRLDSSIFKAWTSYKEANKVGIPKKTEVEAFIADYVQKNAGTDEAVALLKMPSVRLVSGDIGKGAYGAAWRRWPELRTVLADTVNFVQKLGLRVIGRAKLLDQHQDDFYVVGRNIDQVADAVHLLCTSPDSRRIIVSGWNPALIQETALPCCHCLHQLISYDNGPGKKRDLTLRLLLRSADAPVGTPCNVLQYGLLAHMYAHITNHNATKLVVTFGDAHIYDDQIELVKHQLSLEPKPLSAKVVFADGIKEMSDFTFDKMTVTGYSEENHYPAINYPVAV